MKKILSFAVLLLVLLGCTQLSKKSDRSIARDADTMETVLLTGSVDPVFSGGLYSNMVFFNAAKTTYRINVDKISNQQLKNFLTSDRSKNKIHSLQIPVSAIESQNENPTGVRPDCSELPMDYDSLKELTKSSFSTAGSQDIFLDFLKAIPEGSMQSFTLIYSTQSVQNGKEPNHVRPEFPRVLRSNKEGSVSMTYVCDPKSDKYGQVEILYTKDGLIRSAQFDFKNQNADFETKLRKEGSVVRVSENIPQCLNCHSTGATVNGWSLLKYNWQEYHVWADCDEKGTRVYGSNDDEMQAGKFRARTPSNNLKKNQNQCSDQKQREIGEVEKNNFQKFLPKWKQDPCMSLLPWGNTGPGKSHYSTNYEFYPYAEVKDIRNPDGKENYDLRTNLRFNDMYGHQTAIQIAKVIKESPEYPALKYLLALESLNCRNDNSGLIKQANQLVKNLNAKYGVYSRAGNLSTINENAPDSTALGPTLFALSLLQGLKPDDWSMEFVKKSEGLKNDPIYNLAIEADRVSSADSTGNFDFSLIEMVQGILFKDLILSEEKNGQNFISVKLGELADILSKGVEDNFGKRYACLDELGSAIRKDVRRGSSSRINSGVNPREFKNKVCSGLERKHESLMSQISSNLKNCVDCKANYERGQKLKESRLASVTYSANSKETYSQQDLVRLKALGENLVHVNPSTNCFQCHGDTPQNNRVYASRIRKNKNFLFLTANNKFAEHANWDEVMHQVSSGAMPDVSTPITTEQKEAILIYIDSVRPRN